jgi:hypothetical protein
MAGLETVEPRVIVSGCGGEDQMTEVTGGQCYFYGEVLDQTAFLRGRKPASSGAERDPKGPLFRKESRTARGRIRAYV